MQRCSRTKEPSPRLWNRPRVCALFQISGSKQISIIKNGSFYNTDAGVEPDFRLDKPESYYDRPALVEYLHNLK